MLLGAVALGSVRDAQGQQRVVEKSSQPQGWIGIYYVQEKDSLQYPIIMSVAPGSPAQNAGVQSGDTLLSFNGIDARNNFAKLQSFLKPGETIALKLRRNGVRTANVAVGKRHTSEIRIEWKEANSAPEIIQLPPIHFNIGRTVESIITLQARLVIVGAEVAELNQDLANALRLKAGGVLVLSVAPESPAKESGLKGGDVIVKADSLTVLSSQVLLKAMQSTQNRAMNIEVVRKGKTEKLKLRW
jgi:serine protease Do